MVHPSCLSDLVLVLLHPVAHSPPTVMASLVSLKDVTSAPSSAS